MPLVWIVDFWWRIFSAIVAPQIYIHNQVRNIIHRQLRTQAKALSMLHRRSPAELPMSHQRPMECTLEEGSIPASRSRTRMTRRQVFTKVRNTIKALSLAYAMCYIGMLVVSGYGALTRELLFDTIDKQILEIGAVCLAPVHIGHGADMPYVSFGHRSRYPRMIAPTILSVSGREIVSSERSTLCDEEGPPVDRLRREIVTIMFKSHPFLTNETAIVFGDESICLQHMVDIFAGENPCEVRSYTRPGTGAPVVKNEL
jgi:hypothetical protein